jgi:hypothetical protein
MNPPAPCPMILSGDHAAWPMGMSTVSVAVAVELLKSALPNEAIAALAAISAGELGTWTRDWSVTATIPAGAAGGLPLGFSTGAASVSAAGAGMPGVAAGIAGR